MNVLYQVLRLLREKQCIFFQSLPAHWQRTDDPRAPMQMYKAKDVSIWTNDSSPTLSLRLWLPATSKPYYLITAFYKVITNTEMKTSGGLSKSWKGSTSVDSQEEVKRSVLMLIWVQ